MRVSVCVSFFFLVVSYVTVSDNTRKCVRQLTSMKAVWTYFLVDMKRWASLAGTTLLQSLVIDVHALFASILVHQYFL